MSYHPRKLIKMNNAILTLGEVIAGGNPDLVADMKIPVTILSQDPGMGLTISGNVISLPNSKNYLLEAAVTAARLDASDDLLQSGSTARTTDMALQYSWYEGDDRIGAISHVGREYHNAGKGQLYAPTHSSKEARAVVTGSTSISLRVFSFESTVTCINYQPGIGSRIDVAVSTPYCVITEFM